MTIEVVDVKVVGNMATAVLRVGGVHLMLLAHRAEDAVCAVVVEAVGEWMVCLGRAAGLL